MLQVTHCGASQHVSLQFVICADINRAELAKHARRVVQRSALMTAADRGRGPLTSLSAHVTVGAADWTGNDESDFAFEADAVKIGEETHGSQQNGSALPKSGG